MEYKDFCEKYGIANLNPQQEKAVKRVNGATLLLAVPGSGKTTVIVARTGYLIHVIGIPAQNILTLTYTKAAVGDMKERYIKKFGDENGTVPRFSTINAFCVSVIKRCETEKGEVVPELLAQNEGVIRQVAASLMTEYPGDSTVRSLAQLIGKVKNEMMPEEKIKEIENNDVDFAEFYRLYELYLHENNLMDFDDQLIMAYEQMQKYPDILRRIRSRYRYVSLDEAQDTSFIQHKIVQLMVGRAGNIFMVGDEDQSIYGFRGAYPSALLSFKQDYDNADILLMETNYRSDRKIVNTANAFIKRNKNRNDKNMVPFSKKEGAINFTRINDLKDQPRVLLGQIQAHLNADTGETLAILYRNNDSALPLTDFLIENGISVRQRDSSSTFFTHFLITDILDIIAFSKNPRDMEIFSRIYYKIGLFLKKEMLEGIAEYIEAHPEVGILDYVARLPSNKKFAFKIPLINGRIKQLAKLKPAQAISEILYSQIDYWNNWVRRKIDEGMSEFSLKMKLNTLKAIASRYNTIDEFLEALERIKEVQNNKNSTVTLSTLHSSKGLEFDRVIMIDVVDGILPSNSDNMTEEEKEEENRLFYVGITRARHTLDILVGMRYFDMQLDMSPYFTTNKQ